jgi:uncharacterized protein (TIGR02246 family)
MRTTAWMAGALVAILAAAATAQQTTEAGRTARPDDEKAIRHAADAFAKAYNAEDAKTIAAMFDPDGEIVNEAGEFIRGRDDIERTFADIFKRNPKSQMQIDVESIRFIGPATAIEDGMTSVTHSTGLKTERNRYTVVHIKQDGVWRMASARDLPEEPATAEEELKQLEWLIGHWVDESREAVVVTSYSWADDHRAIVSQYKIQVGGKPTMTGTQRIGWDPAAKKIRSWTFDSEGGSAEGVWTRNGDQWIVKLTGVTRDGKQATTTNVLTRTAKHRATWQSRDRVVGDELVPNAKEIVVVKVPPKPAESAPGVHAAEGESK